MKTEPNYNINSAILGLPEDILFVGQEINPKNTPYRPKLVVGSGNFIKNKIDSMIQAEYDIYIIQFPNEKPDAGYKAGLFLQSKNDCRINYSCYTIDSDIKEAIKKCCKFAEETVSLGIKKQEVTKNELKLAVWVTNWIWKLPKVAWKDLVHVEKN